MVRPGRYPALAALAEPTVEEVLFASDVDADAAPAVAAALRRAGARSAWQVRAVPVKELRQAGLSLADTGSVLAHAEAAVKEHLGRLGRLPLETKAVLKALGYLADGRVQALAARYFRKLSLWVGVSGAAREAALRGKVVELEKRAGALTAAAAVAQATPKRHSRTVSPPPATARKTVGFHFIDGDTVRSPIKSPRPQVPAGEGEVEERVALRLRLEQVKAQRDGLLDRALCASDNERARAASLDAAEASLRQQAGDLAKVEAALRAREATLHTEQRKNKALGTRLGGLKTSNTALKERVGELESLLVRVEKERPETKRTRKPSKLCTASPRTFTPRRGLGAAASPAPAATSPCSPTPPEPPLGATAADALSTPPTPERVENGDGVVLSDDGDKSPCGSEVVSPRPDATPNKKMLKKVVSVVPPKPTSPPVKMAPKSAPPTRGAAAGRSRAALQLVANKIARTYGAPAEALCKLSTDSDGGVKKQTLGAFFASLGMLHLMPAVLESAPTVGDGADRYDLAALQAAIEGATATHS